MPQALKSGGASFWIGTKATNGATDTYTQIAKVRQVSSASGGSYTMTDTTALDDTVRQSTKTILDPVDVDIEANEVVADAGQTALKTAHADVTDDPYNFEVRFSQGDKYRMKAKVSQLTIAVGNVTGIRVLRAKLEQTVATTYVAAP